MKFLRIPLAIAAIAALAFPGRSAEEETWKSLGTGLFRSNFLQAFYTIGEFPEFEVEVQECEQIPGRYRIVNPYASYPDYIGSSGCFEGDYYITVDASDPVHCYVTTSRTGYHSGGVWNTPEAQMLIVGSIADDYYNNRYGDWERADKENVCGKLVDGAITFPSRALLGTHWTVSMPWDDDISWRVIDNDMFRLKLPGAPDLDITGELDGLSADRSELLFYVTLGASVEKARVALVRLEESEGAVDGIVSGQIPSKEITADGTVKFPYEGDGRFMLVVVPYFEGVAKPAFTRVVEISYDESEWRKAGRALYREGMISGIQKELCAYGFRFNTYEYEVDIEENVQKPGLIRLVNPYGKDCPLSEGYTYDDTQNYYLYIDATHPRKVMMKKTEDGIGLDFGYGKMYFWSRSDRASNDPNFYGYGYSDEQIQSMGWYGLFDNDEITFPTNTLVVDIPGAQPNAWYDANVKGEFRIKVEPGQLYGVQASGITTVTGDDTDAPAVYYNLDGVRVSGADLAPGIYVVRKGAKTEKVIIR